MVNRHHPPRNPRALPRAASTRKLHGMLSPRWETRDPADPVVAQKLARELRISPLLAELLAARQLGEPGEAEDFLHPRLASLPDPLETPGLAEAARRLASAVEKQEKVVLYGDYDVDGVTSLAILHRFLFALGLPNECFLPLRESEGRDDNALGRPTPRRSARSR